ncbi:MAG: hypothetical protein NTW87_14315 [Planctomycetota bacterium]|nr:hypothetical protein [Planctomycetota bacterium]
MMYSGEQIAIIVFELARTGGNVPRATRTLRDAGGALAGISENTVLRIRKRHAARIRQCEEQVMETVIARRLAKMEAP